MNKTILNTLQLCRGLAAFLVVGHHAGEYVKVFNGHKLLSILFAFGFSGVDFFFVLSGFIIFYANEEYVNHPAKIYIYLKKRFIRIYPAYWIVIIPICALFILFPEILNKPYDITFLNLIQTFTLFQDHPKIIGVSWTLSHEIYFYLLVGLLIVSHKFLFLLILIIVLSIINFSLQFAGLALFSSELLNFYVSPYNLEFLLGVTVFYISKNYSTYAPISILSISSLLFLMMPLYAGLIHLTDTQPHLRVIFLGIPAFFILLSLVDLEKAGRIKIPSILIVLGNASYILYLIHYPLLSALNKIAVKLKIWNYMSPTAGNIIFILLIVFISIQFHKYLENPLLTALNKWKERKISSKIHETNHSVL